SAPTGSPHFAPPPRPRPPKRRTPAPVPKIPQRQNETCRVAPSPQGTAPRGPRADAGCHGTGSRGRPGGRGHRLYAHCSRALTRAAAEMIQMHGAIGITWEHHAHRYFKRGHGAAQLFGRLDEHIVRVAAALIDG